MSTQSATKKTAAKKAAAKKPAAKKTAVPAGAKKPTDRQAKAAKGPEALRVTVRGIEVEIDAEIMDDWTFLEDLAVMDGGSEESMLAGIRILRRLTGEKYGEFRDLAKREKSGRISVESGAGTLFPIIREILEAANPNS